MISDKLDLDLIQSLTLEAFSAALAKLDSALDTAIAIPELIAIVGLLPLLLRQTGN